MFLSMMRALVLIVIDDVDELLYLQQQLFHGGKREGMEVQPTSWEPHPGLELDSEPLVCL